MFDCDNVEDIENLPFNESIGLYVLPKNLTKDEEGLFVMENGKYLPDGAYYLPNGDTLIYEAIRDKIIDSMLEDLPDE